MIYGNPIQPEVKESLIRYRDHGIQTGDWLRACLANDFLMAVGRADHNNVLTLWDVANFIYNELPMPAHGSYEKVDQWIAEKFERTGL